MVVKLLAKYVETLECDDGSRAILEEVKMGLAALGMTYGDVRDKQLFYLGGPGKCAVQFACIAYRCAFQYILHAISY